MKANLNEREIKRVISTKLLEVAPSVHQEFSHQEFSEEDFEALSRWLIALQSPSHLTRMSSINEVADTLSYLTDLPNEESLQFVIDAWMSPSDPTGLKKDREQLLKSNIPAPRLRQIMVRILRLVRQGDKDGLRRTMLFRDSFCELPESPRLQSEETAAAICEMERLLPSITSSRASVRAGPALFRDAVPRASIAF